MTCVAAVCDTAARSLAAREGATSLDQNKLMPAGALSARELTDRLLTRAVVPLGGADVAHIAAHAVCEEVCRQLARSLGALGFHALLTRALAQAENDHALLSEVRVGKNAQPILGGIADLVARHGEPAVAASLESMLETMIELLARLVGIDVVARLVERRAPVGTHDDENDI